MFRFFALLVWLGVCLGVSLGTSANAGRAAALEFDVIVVGSEPEGIVAAVAAAEEGARTLLLSEDARLGGLFVLGAMNTLDLRPEPLVQRGLFERWWTRVGRGAAFDVARAEAIFEDLLEGAGVVVELGAAPLTPVVRGGRVVGVRAGNRTFFAAQTVDATADGDHAAAAGVPYTLGFASLGVEKRMADTLMFRVDGVNWAALRWGVRARGPAYARVGEDAAWGRFGGVPGAYRAEEPELRLRGLNLGRQGDGSVWVNALLVYGVDPLGPASVADGWRRARLEAPRIVRYLRALPGFARATYGGVADRLYLRESRHFATHCTLNVDDTLDNTVRPDDVAAGNYPLDVQSLTPADDGYVYGVPVVYGARLCVALPKGPDDLWIVGKTAGYDPLSASSARVVPFGMALGEAVGVAAAGAAQAGVSARTFALGDAHVQTVRRRLQARGAYLPVVEARIPTGPVTHPHFEAYRTLRRKGLAVGGYDNDPRLDEVMPTRGFIRLLSHVGERFWRDDTLGGALTERFPDLYGPLTPALAQTLTDVASCQLRRCSGLALPLLVTGDDLPDDLAQVLTRDVLTRGEAYELAAALASAARR